MAIEFVDKAPDNVGDTIFYETFSSTLDEKERIVETLMENLRGSYVVLDSEDDIRIRLCIEEVITNAVEHGNNCDPDKSVEVTLCGNKQQWSLRVVGEGEGFEIPEEPQKDDILSYRGRGLSIIESLIDEVYYYQKGNAVLFIHKTRESKE